MAATVKNLVVENTGIEFEIRNQGGEFLGDLFVTATGLTWCKGKTSKAEGHTANWAKFIQIMSEVDDA